MIGLLEMKRLSLSDSGEYKAAIVLYDPALELHPGDSAIWNDRGLALNRS
jgi:hypothetical protein